MNKYLMKIAGMITIRPYRGMGDDVPKLQMLMVQRLRRNPKAAGTTVKKVMDRTNMDATNRHNAKLTAAKHGIDHNDISEFVHKST
jgi:hypothetical protein